MAARAELSARHGRRDRLRYVHDFERGFGRRRCGRGFVYLSTQGAPIRCERTRQRIEELAIPPAWTSVWICPDPTGHIQAVGRDGTGRRQYIYHADWEFIRAQTKYDRMRAMAEHLPRIRRRIRRHLAATNLTKERVVASVVRVIDKTSIRVGNVAYARIHGSRGATTLTAENVQCRGPRILLSFVGKSGKRIDTGFADARVAEVIRCCEQVDSPYLFCYRADDGEFRSVMSTDVNDYLRAAADAPISAKDFRTWWGSVLALRILSDFEAEDPDPARRKRLVVEAVTHVADRLANTKAVCRQSYIHPGIIAAFEQRRLCALLERSERRCQRRPEMSVDEARFAAMLPLLA